MLPGEHMEVLLNKETYPASDTFEHGGIRLLPPKLTMFFLTTCYWYSDGKESACSVGDQVPSVGQEDPLEKGRATHSSILPGEFHGQRSLVGYSPWSCKELDMIEWLTLFIFAVVDTYSHIDDYLRTYE